MTERFVFAYERVAGDLREHITSGLYSRGEQLPSLPRLAEMFGVRVGVIRSALKLLHDEGLLISRNGAGHYVTPSEDDTDPGIRALVAVCRYKVLIPQLAKHLDAPEQSIGRMLRGERYMTREWSEKIIRASAEIAEDFIAE